jgi:hypothetical protein
MSTGPRTAAGKAVSRSNALVHGLCASVLVPEDAKMVFHRTNDFFDTLRPQNDFHCWCVSEVSIVTLRIDRSERIDRRVRDKIAIRAETSWDDDKRLEAELLGEQLANRPAVVIERLKATPQGCEWLVGRWAMLAYEAESKGAWTPSQIQLAYDLLATPADFRDGQKPGVSVDLDGKVIDPGDDLAAVARREIAELKARIERIAGLDEANRALAMADLNDDHDPELKRVRRYEGTLHTQLRWYMKQLQETAPTREVPQWLKAKWIGQQAEVKAVREAETKQKEELAYRAPAAKLPEAEPVAEPKPDWYNPRPYSERLGAPFELEPHEIPPIGQKPDFDAILAARASKKRKKVEDLREDRRPKVRRLLG